MKAPAMTNAANGSLPGQPVVGGDASDTSSAAPACPTDAESPILYPCAFPIKIMGAKAEGFVEALIAVALEHDPAFDASAIELRDSSGGRYQSVTITVTATSRAQLDALYRALTAHPMVKVVL
jgi:putative lipoic acid-binding regulatory protein